MSTTNKLETSLTKTCWSKTLPMFSFSLVWMEFMLFKSPKNKIIFPCLFLLIFFYGQPKISSTILNPAQEKSDKNLPDISKITNLRLDWFFKFSSASYSSIHLKILDNKNQSKKQRKQDQNYCISWEFIKVVS